MVLVGIGLHIGTESFLPRSQQLIAEPFGGLSVDAEVEAHEAVVFHFDGAVGIINR